MSVRSRRKQLPPGIAYVGTDDVHCDTCDKTFKYNSLRKHLTSKGHIDNVASDAAAADQIRQAEAQYLALFDDSEPDFESGYLPPPAASSPPPPTGPRPTDPGLLLETEATLADYAHNYTSAHAAPDPRDYQQRQAEAAENLTVDLTLLFLHDELTAHENDGDATITEDTAAELRREQDDEPPLSDNETHSAMKGDWAPYPTRTMFFVDLLDGLPRLRMSDAQLRMVLWVMGQCGARDVPSLWKLRKWQAKLHDACATETLSHRSSMGNLFYSNNICGTIAMDFAKPSVAKLMRHYPEISSKGISEVRHADRWAGVDRSLLTPMHANGSEHFYVNELCELKPSVSAHAAPRRRFFLPKVWHLRDDVLHATGHSCSINAMGTLHVNTNKEVYVTADQFLTSMPTLVANNSMPSFDEQSETLRQRMPNPLRELADGAELYTVFLFIWGDDVSGNVSKQYNKHNNLYISNLNLPAELLNQEFFIHFFSTSPHASTAEQFSAIKDQMQQTLSHPFPAFNAHTLRPCKFRLFPFGFPADNPQQSDECSCALGQATCNCRKCKNRRRPPAGTTEDDVDWYIQNYAPGEPRKANETVVELQNQLALACSEGITAVRKSQTKTGVKDCITEFWISELLQRAKDFKAADKSLSAEQLAVKLQEWLSAQPGDKHNVLLNWLGVDPHEDTPVEILHTVLLGLVKYMWHALHTSWTSSPQKSQLFVARLEATDLKGLNIPPIRAAYMMQYKNGLIGKHFKTLAQTSAFHVHDLADEALYRVVKATGELLPVLWYPLIKDMDAYLKDLQTLIDNVLAAYAAIDPLRILEKVKIHILTHIVADIPRFGPGVRFSTEIFECFNAIFRMCSVLSNHLAPSRDIALSIADMDRLKHIISGGYWFNGIEWVQASQKVRDVLLQHRIVQQHLGWTPSKTFVAGSITPTPAQKRVFRQLVTSDLDLLAVWNLASAMEQIRNARWASALNVTSRTGDICVEQSWICFEDPMEDAAQRDGKRLQHIGRISDVLVPSSGLGLKGVVKVERYIVGTQLHRVLDMPVLKYERDMIIPAANVLFLVNVQHDCITAKCSLSGKRTLRQERQDSAVEVPAWAHTASKRYVVNTHALHNALQLREMLLRSLTQPRPIWSEGREELKAYAGIAWHKYVTKEQQRQAKSAATRERNRQKKQGTTNEAEDATAEVQDAVDEVGSEDGVQSESGGEDDGMDAQSDDDGNGGMPNDDDEYVPSPSRPHKRRRQAKK